MGKLTEHNGSLFDSEPAAIGHGVNTVGAMGAGIAKAFSSLYPDMYREYNQMCKSDDLVAGGAWVWFDDKSDDIVLNIASQDSPGAHARLEWVRSGTIEAIKQLRERYPEYSRIALPRIGSGIGGLQWEDVREVLSDIAEEQDIDIEVWFTQ